MCVCEQQLNNTHTHKKQKVRYSIRNIKKILMNKKLETIAHDQLQSKCVVYTTIIASRRESEINLGVRYIRE